MLLGSRAGKSAIMFDLADINDIKPLIAVGTGPICSLRFNVNGTYALIDLDENIARVWVGERAGRPMSPPFIPLTGHTKHYLYSI